MLKNAFTVEGTMFARRCVKCGYDGRLLDSDPERCIRCGCDFFTRPPRSYAEMEGLAPPMPPASPMLSLSHLPQSLSSLSFDVEPYTLRPSRLVQRWLAFLFLTMIMLLSIFYLAAAAMVA